MMIALILETYCQSNPVPSIPKSMFFHTSYTCTIELLVDRNVQTQIKYLKWASCLS